MKPLLALSLFAALGVCPLAAEAAGVCYVAVTGDESSTHYSSAPFEYDGKDIESSPQAKEFFAYARQKYNLPTEARNYCRHSGFSVEEELQSEMSGEYTLFDDIVINYVPTGFKPPNR